jgi:hypothetical protein
VWWRNPAVVYRIAQLGWVRFAAPPGLVRGRCVSGVVLVILLIQGFDGLRLGGKVVVKGG